MLHDLWFYVCQRIDVAAVDCDFEVEVDAGGATDASGVALLGDYLASNDVISSFDIKLRGMAVTGLKTVAVVYDNCIAVAIVFKS